MLALREMICAHVLGQLREQSVSCVCNCCNMKLQKLQKLHMQLLMQPQRHAFFLEVACRGLGAPSVHYTGGPTWKTRNFWHCLMRLWRMSHMGCLMRH